MRKSEYERQEEKEYRQKMAEFNTNHPWFSLVIGGLIAMVGLINGLRFWDLRLFLVLFGFGAIYSLQYFYWKRKHDDEYGE